MAQKHTLDLSTEEEEQLTWYRDRDPRPYVRTRASAILKVAQGFSARWVAHHGLLRRYRADTVYNWLNWYRSEGVEGLAGHPRGGARSKGVEDCS